MAAVAMTAQPLRILPQISAPAFSRSARIFSLYTRQLVQPMFPTLAALPAINLNIPAWLGGIWESVLRAVPKKKTSHSKKRHRQMAGKALQDVKSLCKCPGCGQVKRQHVLCPTCTKSIQNQWKDFEAGKYF
ncbi:putative 54S ribosomal protein L32 [Colletotrichum siamense]|uniref:Large ribosomal subunit protein bL32m n=1 Tax=Colletotrichum siamense TaxID=690259 RepID=A0A9P5BPE0_COLSI|nr:putative 54S ribosomal protein L32 [Colletotrichum siamense]KAF4828528.1 putative 54S ribosomal protein L32 [Colletotrichum tropicale]KAI8154819.1 putative 54S ribosomal protein L32 [Colletotrichum sp. SAR 10_71]KAI8160969.1 putative 54S ribosomal protein L32 [Colletotrichum sp. SAR 10_70]KAI8186404.1 putative 54S ribosomal protein L32 [Colletotrichum sp. SAR 10_65]KAI8223515.1 putative 54S ribosomal protein L32 [Colletotrichum sp. SAR 10_77]KAI8231729.1 putative 54S ribosomal protein L32 